MPSVPACVDPPSLLTDLLPMSRPEAVTLRGPGTRNRELILILEPSSKLFRSVLQTWIIMAVLLVVIWCRRWHWTSTGATYYKLFSVIKSRQLVKWQSEVERDYGRIQAVLRIGVGTLVVLITGCISPRLQLHPLGNHKTGLKTRQ